MEVYFRISRLALVVFEENQKLSLKGVGLLKQTFLNASYAPSSQTILPPKTYILFKKNTQAEIDLNLLHKVSTLLSCSVEEAKFQIESWQEAWIERLKKEPFAFGEFGYFFAGEGVDFAVNSINFYDYLPEMNTILAEDMPNQLPFERENNLVPSVKKKTSRKSKNESSLLWSILVLLFGISIYFWAVPILAAISPIKDYSLLPVNVSPSNYSYDNEMENIYHDSVTASNSVISTNASTSGNLKNGASKNTSFDSVRETAEPILPAEQCTLVVGAFKRKSNVRTMLNKIEKYQFETILLQRNTLTLVGVVINDADTTAKSLIYSEIDPNAWEYKY